MPTMKKAKLKNKIKRDCIVGRIERNQENIFGNPNIPLLLKPPCPQG